MRLNGVVVSVPGEMVEEFPDAEVLGDLVIGPDGMRFIAKGGDLSELEGFDDC